MVVRPAGLLFGDKWPAAALVPPTSPPQQLERQHDSSVTSQTLCVCVLLLYVVVLGVWSISSTSTPLSSVCVYSGTFCANRSSSSSSSSNISSAHSCGLERRYLISRCDDHLKTDHAIEDVNSSHSHNLFHDLFHNLVHSCRFRSSGSGRSSRWWTA